MENITSFVFDFRGHNWNMWLVLGSGFFVKHVEVTQKGDRLFMVESDPLAGHSKVKGLKQIFLCLMCHIESAHNV